MLWLILWEKEGNCWIGFCLCGCIYTYVGKDWRDFSGKEGEAWFPYVWQQSNRELMGVSAMDVAREELSVFRRSCMSGMISLFRICLCLCFSTCQPNLKGKGESVLNWGILVIYKWNCYFLFFLMVRLWLSIFFTFKFYHKFFFFFGFIINFLKLKFFV